jgi:hypothetical protein
MSKFWFHFAYFFHRDWLTVTLVSKDGNVAKVGEPALAVIYSVRVEGGIAVDWADGSTTEINWADIESLLVTR